MAYELNGLDLPFVAAADLSAAQNLIVYKNTTVNQVALATAKTVAIIGVLLNKPNAAGRVATVRCGGISKVVVGAAVAVGDMLTSDSAGKAIKLTASDADSCFYLGYALQAATAINQVISVLVMPGFFKAGGAIS